MSRIIQRLSSLIPTSLREAIIEKLRSGLFRRGIPRGALPVDGLGYLPTDKESDSYVLGPWPDEAGYETCHQGLPVPPLDIRLGYGADIAEYLRLGHEHVKLMLDILKSNGFEPSVGHRILELGCAGGRMLRQLYPYADRCELWGVDINAAAMHWCQRYLSPPFHFATTTTVPHLPFEQHHFDLVFAGSVFTHIDDLTRAWLLELHRVLKPGAWLYLSLHDRHCMGLLEPEYVRDELPSVMEQKRQTRLGQQRFAAKLAGDASYQRWKSEPFDMLVLWRDKLSQVFVELEYFKRIVHPMFEPVSSHPEAYAFQTSILLRRRQ